MDKQNFNQLQELEFILNELETISNEIDPDSEAIDKAAILGGPLDNIGKIIDAGNYAIGKYSEIAMKGGIMGGGKQVVIDELNKVKDVFKPKEKDGFVPPKPPGTPKIYDTSGGQRAINIQAAGAKPIEVKLQTDIKVRTFGDIDLDGLSSDSFRKTPIVLSRQVLDFAKLYNATTDSSGALVYNSNSIFAQYVNSVVNRLNEAAQKRVNFATEFSYKEIAQYLSTLCSALNTKYGLYSIIQFEQDYNNKNMAMQAMRRTLSAEDLNVLDIFNQDLGSVPIPPRLAELFYMLNANYRWADLPKAPIIKFTNADILDNKIFFNISSEVTSLNNSNFRKTCNKIVRTIPNWCGNDIPMYGPETYHSPNFNTIFANSGVVQLGGPASSQTYAYAPSFDSTASGYLSRDWTYFSNTNELDGLTTAMFAAWDKKDGTSGTLNETNWMTGLFRPKPFTQWDHNRAIFYNNQLQNLDEGTSDSNIFTYSINPTNNNEFMHVMKVYQEQIYGLSPISLRETNKELVDWLFDIGSIPGRESNSSNKSKSPRKRNRSRGKKMGKD